MFGVLPAAKTGQGQGMEPGVQIRLHKLTKRQYLMVFSFFFIAFAVTVIIGAVSHPVLSSVRQPLGSDWSMVPSNASDAITFSGQSPPDWTVFTQEVWLKCVIHNHFYSKGDKYRLLKFGLRVEALSGLDRTGQWQPLYPDLETLNHNRELRCEKFCSEFTVVHLGKVSHSQYQVTFVLDEINDPIIVDNVTMEWEYFSPEFTQLQIWSQFVFIILTFVAAYQFFHALRPYNMADWCLEQRWLSVLVVELVLFNNPFFPLRFLVRQTWGARFFAVLFKSTFISTLLLFWLCTLHTISVSSRKFLMFYLPKILVVVMVWLSAVTLLSWEEYNLLSDPSYQLHLDTTSFTGWKIVFFISLGVYLFFLVYVTIRAFGAQTPADLRLKFFASLMLIMVVIIGTLLIVHIGADGLRPSFFGPSIVRYKSAAELLSMSGALNYYIFTLAYVYSPFKNATTEPDMKSNSSFEMLYDIDGEEETLYSDSGFDQDDEYAKYK